MKNKAYWEYYDINEVASKIGWYELPGKPNCFRQNFQEAENFAEIWVELMAWSINFGKWLVFELARYVLFN